MENESVCSVAFETQEKNRHSNELCWCGNKVWNLIFDKNKIEKLRLLCVPMC